MHKEDSAGNWEENHSPAAVRKKHEETKKLGDFQFVIEVGLQAADFAWEEAQEGLRNFGRKNRHTAPIHQTLMNWIELMELLQEKLKAARERGHL